MKKVFLSAALALAVASSWAFYPKAPAEPVGYMMVISSVAAGSIFSGITATITTVAPDGTEKKQPVEFKRTSVKKAAESLEDVQVAALAKVNEYARSGWRLVNSTPSALTAQGNTVVYQSVYLLEKQ